MKTPKSASKPEKTRSALSTPTSGKITKHKKSSMPMSLKAIENNAKLALLKSQDTVTLNGKSPKTPKNVGTPKKGGSPGSPKNAGTPKKEQNQKQSPSPGQNGTAGKKRKSPGGTPANVGKAGGKKHKKSPEVSPEVKLGLKIEQLLASPKDKKPVDSAQPSGKLSKSQKKKAKLAQSAEDSTPKAGNQPKGTPQSPGSSGKKSRRQRQKEAKRAKKNAQSTEVGPVPVADKKKKLQQKVEAKKLGKKNAQLQQKAPASPESPKSPKKKNKKRSDKKREKKLSKSLNESKDNLFKEIKASSNAGAFPNPTHAETAIQALIDDEKERKAEKPELLDEPSPVMAVATFFYHPPARHLERIVMPHPHIHGTPDVMFIAVDMKKAKNDPEESIDFHTNLFKSNGVTSITEIVPMKKIRKEYTQLEEKRKFVNRADVILVDSRIAHRIPSLVPAKFTNRKAPIPVRMTVEPSKIKNEIGTALRKTTVLLKEHSLSVAIKIGHVGMKKAALVENLAAVAAGLCDEKRFPGGKPNIKQLYVKCTKSESYPVYISCVPRSQIPEPTPKAPPKRKRAIVEGEVTTAGVTVAVHPSGEIEIKSKDVDLDETEHDTSPKKKKKGASNEDSDESDDIDDSDLDDADSDDDLDPAEVEKFLKANKAEDDDDENDSEEEGGEIEKAEQEFLLALRKQQDALEADAQKAQKGKKAGKKEVQADYDDDDDESNSEEEEEDLDEEDELDDDSDEESDDADIPKLVPAKVAQPQKSKGGKGGKPGQNGLQAKGKPGAAQKGKPKAAQKAKPNASQKRGSFRKTKDSPKAKRR